MSKVEVIVSSDLTLYYHNNPDIYTFLGKVKNISYFWRRSPYTVRNEYKGIQLIVCTSFVKDRITMMEIPPKIIAAIAALQLEGSV